MFVCSKIIKPEVKHKAEKAGFLVFCLSNREIEQERRGIEILCTRVTYVGAGNQAEIREGTEAGKDERPRPMNLFILEVRLRFSIQ